MNTWIFQANPNEFDITRFLRRRKNIWWRLNQKHYENKIKRDDEVYIWRSDGKKQGSGGILAKARITNLFIKSNVDFTKNYWYMEDWDDSNPRVTLYVSETRFKDGFIKKVELQEHSILKNLHIFKMRNLTNYLLTEQEAVEMKKLWDNSNASQISFPPLKHSTRNREYNKYPEIIRDKIVYNYLFEGKTPRWLDENIIGISSSYSRGWQSMGVLHFLGLVEAHKGIFKNISVKDAMTFLNKYSDEGHHKIAFILKRYLQNLYDDNIQFFTPNEESEKLFKIVGTSQYTDGVRIDKEFHDIFNPENSPYYVERGKARKIKILFNNKVFDAEYRFEDQTDKSLELQSIRFRKELKEEFKRVFPSPEGEFAIQQGVDLNHFMFSLPINYYDDEKYQDLVMKSVPSRTEEKPQPKPTSRSTFSGKVWDRNPKIAKEALELSKYCCEFDSDHKTFISIKTKANFVEAHHLIPMKEQSKFSHSLDVPGNIVSLCPNCHRAIHHGEINHKNKMLKQLYLKRVSMLERFDIKVTIDDLLEMYN